MAKKDELHDFVDWVGKLVLSMLEDKPEEEKEQMRAGLKTAHALVPVYRLQRTGEAVIERFKRAAS